MHCKVLFKKSVFVLMCEFATPYDTGNAINYNYHSVKYDLCKDDCYCDVAYLPGKINFKYIFV